MFILKAGPPPTLESIAANFYAACNVCNIWRERDREESEKEREEAGSYSVRLK